MLKIHGYVYLVRNRVSGKVYVGQTTYTVAYRWRKHITHARKRKTVFADAIRSYGPDAFDVVELGRAFSERELDEMEARAVWSYSSDDREFGYNMDPGGNQSPKIGNKGRKFSAEHRAKISKALTGRKMSPEACAKNGDSKRGRKLSAEHRAKLAETSRGRKHSDEARAKIAAGNRGKSFSLETRAKMKAAWILRRQRGAEKRDSRGRWVSQN